MFFIALISIVKASLDAISADWLMLFSIDLICSSKPILTNASFIFLASWGKGILIRELPLNPLIAEASFMAYSLPLLKASTNPFFTSCSETLSLDEIKFWALSFAFFKNPI